MQSAMERVAAAGFRMVPLEDLSGHVLFERDGWMAMAPFSEGVFGRPGNPCVYTADGFAVLVRLGDGYALVGRNSKRPISPELAIQARTFTADLERALGY